MAKESDFDTSLLTMSQVAKFLNMSENTVRNFIRKKEIPFFLLGGIYRFKKDDIMGWVDKQKGKRPPHAISE